MKITRRLFCRIACPSLIRMAKKPLVNPVLPLFVGFHTKMLMSLSSFSTDAPAAKLEDKKFHCSVCKKSFRLEMAASLHIKQAHSGNATVEAGQGPGEIKVAPPVGQSPPREEGGRSTSYGGKPFRKRDDEEEPNFEGGWIPKKKRALPKPLYKPDDEVAEDVTTALLEVWDKIGNDRIGGDFVTSDVVVRVGASGQAHDADKPDTTKVWIPKASVVEEVENSPFAMATTVAESPFVAAATENPFLHAHAMKAAKEASKRSQQVGAPSPFSEAAMQKSAFGAGAPASPFAQAAAQHASPFAQAASPFASAGLPGQAASPFASQASPFASSGQAASPFAHSAPSPFGTPGAQPFQVGQGLPFPGMSPDMLLNQAYFPGMSGGTSVEEEKRFTCTSCGRAFKLEGSLAAHYKSKHNIDMPTASKKSGAKKQPIPDLPAYVPSPVDLSATSPFGVDDEKGQSDWNAIEMFPHAHSFSNTNIISKVKKADVIDEVLTLVVNLPGGEHGDEEIPVKVRSPLADSLKDKVHEGSTVSIVGQLRLNPQHDANVNKYFYMPVVDVVPPMGTLHCLD